MSKAAWLDRVKYGRLIREQVIRQLAEGTHRRNITAAAVARAVGISQQSVPVIVGMAWPDYLSTSRFDRGSTETAGLLRGRASPKLNALRLLAVGMDAAGREGLHAVTRSHVRHVGKLARTAVYDNFASDAALQDAIAREAARRLFEGETEMQAEGVALLADAALLRIVGEAIALRLPSVQELSAEAGQAAALAVVKYAASSGH